jgi:5-(carboxyamino)imidazole ribonucleotide synthase
MKIGILGGGQLAKMLALSAQSLDITITCIDPKIGCSATKAADVLHVDFCNTDAIEKHFQSIDCMTYETENLPYECIERLAEKYKIFPPLEALRITQDRLLEKKFLQTLNSPTAPFSEIHSLDDLTYAITSFGLPVVLKTRLSGYDGKGQIVIRHLDEVPIAWEMLRTKPLILEKFISYDFEVSIISARDKSGNIVFYPLVLNHHERGILHMSEAPYHDESFQEFAEKYASLVLEKLNYIGIMTIEFFCINRQLIANEIAPRVHNSGHWTLEGAETSQFENHIRAISGLPLGSTHAKGFSTMINIIGKYPDATQLTQIPGCYYHTYDKEAQPNRKLGHITICAAEKNTLALNTKKVLAIINPT